MYEGVDVNKTNGLHEHIICHYWYFIEINFRFQPEVMTELMRWLPWFKAKAMNFKDVAIVCVKEMVIEFSFSCE